MSQAETIALKNARVKIREYPQGSAPLPAIPPGVALTMPESSLQNSQSTDTSAERYNLSLELKKTTTGGQVCHRIIVESNGLTLEETKEMQKELIPALSGFVEKDAPQV